METLANLEGALPVTLLCSVVGSPSQQLSGLALAVTPGALPAPGCWKQSPRVRLQQELAGKAMGTDSYLFRGCFPLSTGYCVHRGARKQR